MSTTLRCKIIALNTLQGQPTVFFHDGNGLSMLNRQQFYSTFGAHFVDWVVVPYTHRHVYRLANNLFPITTLSRFFHMLCFRKQSEFFHHKPQHPDLYVKKVSDKIGFGVFTRKLLPIGTLIGVYTGLFRPKNTVTNKRYVYQYGSILTPGQPCIDASRYGNITRFINHSRYTNLSADTTFYKRKWHVYFETTHTIYPHHQLLINYGPAYFVENEIEPIDLMP